MVVGAPCNLRASATRAGFGPAPGSLPPPPRRRLPRRPPPARADLHPRPAPPGRAAAPAGPAGPAVPRRARPLSLGLLARHPLGARPAPPGPPRAPPCRGAGDAGPSGGLFGGTSRAALLGSDADGGYSGPDTVLSEVLGSVGLGDGRPDGPAGAWSPSPAAPRGSGPGADEGDADGPHGAAVGRAVYEVLRLDKSGKTRRLYMRRRDLIRQFDLLPRDLRRIDPTLSVTRTSPTLMPREKAVLVNMSGVRLIVTAGSVLVFEPQGASSQKYLSTVLPRVGRGEDDRNFGRDRYLESSTEEAHASTTPFELDMVEGALVVATSKLDAELVAVYARVQEVLSKVAVETTPVNLEELRRVKSSLVELESRAEGLVQLLEEVLDDVDELRDFNLSSRPAREEKRRQRERDRLERERDSRRQERDERDERERDEREERAASEAAAAAREHAAPAAAAAAAAEELRRLRREASSAKADEWANLMDEQYDSEVDDAIRELEDAEIEEQELEEVEDLLEYYLQVRRPRGGEPCGETLPPPTHGATGRRPPHTHGERKIPPRNPSAGAEGGGDAERGGAAAGGGARHGGVDRGVAVGAAAGGDPVGAHAEHRVVRRGHRGRHLGRLRDEPEVQV